MVFKILTDKEIEELKERAVLQRNFYAGNLLRKGERQSAAERIILLLDDDDGDDK